MRTLLTKILTAIFLAIVAIQPVLAQNKPLKIGVSNGPMEQIFEVVKREAAKQGLNIQVVVFNDVRHPLVALATGDLDANCYTYQSRVNKFNAERHYKHKLVSIAKMIVIPLGIYSNKIKHLDDLPQGAKVGIPNDPINSDRVLLLLQAQGLIKLDRSAGATATPLDVIENPKKIRFVELDAAQMPRSLGDTDASGIISNYAIAAGLDPAKDAIVKESADSPYAAVFVVREQDKDRPEWQKLLAVYRSQVVKDFIVSTFKSALIPARLELPDSHTY